MSLIEIFKTGSHTDSQGRKHTVSTADLDKIAKNYDPAKHEAPVVIGHPKSDHPAWAWVESLQRVGDKLYYKEKDTVPEFNEMRSKKMFKKRSISLYPDGTLKHIGWLGAMPPAIKGLQDVAFGEGEDCTIYEFAETAQENTIMKKKLEEMQAKLDTEKAARVKAEGTATNYKEKLDSQTADFAESESKGKRQEIANFVEQGIKDGKILPAWKAMGLVSFMENLGGVARADTTLEFAEGEKSEKTEPGDWFKKFIASFSEHPLFKDMAKPQEEKGADAEFAEEEKLGAEMAAMVNPAS